MGGYSVGYFFEGLHTEEKDGGYVVWGMRNRGVIIRSMSL